MDIKERMRAGRERALAYKTRCAELVKVPQRRQSGFEIAAYFFVPLLLTAAGAMPSTAVFFMPVVLPLLYLLYRRFGAALPFSCVAFYGLFALLFNYDVLTVIFFVFLMFALSGVIISVQFRQYLLCMAISAVFAVAGASLGMGIVRLAEGEPLGDIAAHYIARENADPFISALSHNYYENTKVPPEIGRVKPGEKGYHKAAIEFFADYARDELDAYAPYVCVHFGGLFGLLAYFISVVVNRRTAGPFDENVSKEELSLGTRCMGGVGRELTPLRDMKFPRSYLWAVFLPGFTASLLLDIVGGYEALSATLMHVFVTIPAAAAFTSLLAYFASLFSGKARAAAYVVFCLISAAAIVFPTALFFCSMFGVSDVLLDLRYWTEFLRSDD